MLTDTICPKCGRSMILKHDIGFGSVCRYKCDCGFDTHNVKLITENKPNIPIDGRRGFTNDREYAICNHI